jgi:hypothetical protein
MSATGSTFDAPTVNSARHSAARLNPASGRLTVT